MLCFRPRTLITLIKPYHSFSNMVCFTCWTVREEIHSQRPLFILTWLFILACLALHFLKTGIQNWSLSTYLNFLESQIAALLAFGRLTTHLFSSDRSRAEVANSEQMRPLKFFPTNPHICPVHANKPQYAIIFLFQLGSKILWETWGRSREQVKIISTITRLDFLDVR